MKYITDYNDQWPARFTEITAYISEYLVADCVFHHVGSTSVSGMPAKDIIDIDIEYVQGEFSLIVRSLNKAGYEHLGDLGIVGREAFKGVPGTCAASLPAHHLYVCKKGAYELRKHLAYRDYLRANPDRAQWLAGKKIQADSEATSRDGYIENKSPYYEIITKESMMWADDATQ